MIERAIENWLTSTNERNYQTPFCQTLVHGGERVLYISRHGPLEQGKDVISRHPLLGLRAFQLKTGDIDLPAWRKIRGECEELIGLPIVHPSVDKREPFRAYLAANGSVSDEVRLQIDQMNEDTLRKARGWAKLEILDLQSLLKYFLDAQGDFIPREPSDLKVFLELYLSPGEELVDVERWFKYLNSFAFNTRPVRPSDVVNAISASVVQVALGLQAYQRSGNHFALFQAWTALSACIRRYALKYDLSLDVWRASYELSLAEAVRTLEDLEADFLKKPDLLEGNLLADGGIVYRARSTIVTGTLCTLANYRARKGVEGPDDALLRAKILEESPRIWYWGESACPFFYELITFLEAEGDTSGAQRRLLELLDGTLNLNSSGGTGSLPAPYVSVTDLLEHALGVREEPIDFSQFAGSSFALEVFVLLATRRGMRPALEARWRQISKIICRGFEPHQPEDILDWHVQDGINRAFFFAPRQSWSELATRARSVPGEALILREEIDLAHFFLLACPHRFGWRIVSILENGVDKAFPSSDVEVA